jgi:hypothetical protein
MRGIAAGAERELLDIVALNVRTEINFGLFSDGCTALAWHTAQHAWLGQNWDVSGHAATQKFVTGYLIHKDSLVDDGAEAKPHYHKDYTGQ